MSCPHLCDQQLAETWMVMLPPSGSRQEHSLLLQELNKYCHCLSFFSRVRFIYFVSNRTMDEEEGSCHKPFCGCGYTAWFLMPRQRNFVMAVTSVLQVELTVKYTILLSFTASQHLMLQSITAFSFLVLVSVMIGQHFPAPSFCFKWSH